jgi:hypothetical protein
MECETCLQVTLQNLDIFFPSVKNKTHYPEVQWFLKILQRFAKWVLA